MFAIAKKLNMTQLFTKDGRVIPVTVLKVAKNEISQVKTEDKDGYRAVQIRSGKTRSEFSAAEGEFKAGQEIRISDFKPGELLKVSGISKGRGFAGTMKRHGFHGAPASHGHDHPRAVGSIGQMFPQHVRPGLRMAGRMGGRKATDSGLLLVAVDDERGLLFVKGSVPGSFGGIVRVFSSGRQKNALELAVYGESEEKPEEKKVIEEQKNAGK